VKYPDGNGIKLVIIDKNVMIFWLGIDETNVFQLKFFPIMKIVGDTGLGGLWALERAWHIRVIYLRCAQGYGI